MSDYINFAKTFETAIGQVLAYICENDEGKIGFKLSCVHGEGYFFSIFIGGWKNDEKGFQKCQDQFEEIQQKEADNFAERFVSEVQL